MTSEKQISPPSLALKMQIANFIVDKIPKATKTKRIMVPYENNMKVQEA